MPSHVEVILSSIFDWFLFQFARILKLKEFDWKNKYLLGFRPFQLNLTTMRFRCPTSLHFGAKLAPKIWKITSYAHPRRIVFCHHFGIDFYAIWAPSWDPSCGHVGLLWPIKRTQDSPKKQNKRSWASRRSQDRFFIDVWSMFARFWIDFGLIFWKKMGWRDGVLILFTNKVPNTNGCKVNRSTSTKVTWRRAAKRQLIR